MLKAEASTLPSGANAGPGRRLLATRMLVTSPWSGYLWLICLLCLFGCANQAEQHQHGFAIVDVTVIDAVHGLRQHRSVIVRGDTITKVQAADQPLPAVDRIINGQGRFLIPGLWDFHVHLTYTDELTESMGELFLSYGITSIRDTGGMLDKLLPVVSAMRAEGARAPRVFYAGPLLDGEQVVYDGQGREHLGVAVATPAAARAMVQQLKQQGADFIKIYELVSPEVFAALVATARELGLPIEAHVPLVMSARQAGAQVDGIAHLRNIELDCAANAQELLQQRIQAVATAGPVSAFELRNAVRREQILPAIKAYDPQRCALTMAALGNTLQGPTLRLNAYGLSPPYTREDWPQALAAMPEPVRSQWREFAQQQLKNPPTRDLTEANFSLFLSGELYRSGVPFAAGTDTPIGFAIPGYSLHRELELLAQAGLAPLDVLAAATLEPARFFSLENELGAIAPGYRADLVLLEANPLTDIRNTRRIAQVIANGQPL